MLLLFASSSEKLFHMRRVESEINAYIQTLGEEMDAEDP